MLILNFIFDLFINNPGTYFSLVGILLGSMGIQVPV